MCYNSNLGLCQNCGASCDYYDLKSLKGYSRLCNDCYNIMTRNRIKTKIIGIKTEDGNIEQSLVIKEKDKETNEEKIFDILNKMSPDSKYYQNNIKNDIAKYIVNNKPSKTRSWTLDDILCTIEYIYNNDLAPNFKPSNNISWLLDKHINIATSKRDESLAVIKFNSECIKRLGDYTSDTVVAPPVTFSKNSEKELEDLKIKRLFKRLEEDD